MATAISGTSITFNDATVQTTAASGSTTFDAIGSVGYFLYYSAGTTNLTAGNTIAGSSLYYVSTIVANVTDQQGMITNGSVASGSYTRYEGSAAVRVRASPTPASQVPPLGMTTLSGTWRAMNAVSRSASYVEPCSNAAYNNYSASVFMRVS